MFVSGRVQGVNFRYYTESVAQRLNLTGWVRNLSDRRVEIIAEGKEGDINKLINFLKKGSVLARVDNLDIKKEKYTGKFSGFEIKY